jgi:hypothetical protein
MKTAMFVLTAVRISNPITKYFSQDIRSLGRDVNPGFSEYEAGMLTTHLRRSVCCWRRPDSSGLGEGPMVS